MSDLGLLVLRLITGGILAAHGYPKLFGGPNKKPPDVLAEKLGPGFVEAWSAHGGEAWAERLEALGVPNPKAMAVFTGLVETVGGACIALGWFSRPAALLAAGEMAAAIERVHFKNGLMVSKGGYEFTLLILGACLAILLGGPGRLSVDGD